MPAKRKTKHPKPDSKRYHSATSSFSLPPPRNQAREEDPPRAINSQRHSTQPSSPSKIPGPIFGLQAVLSEIGKNEGRSNARELSQTLYYIALPICKELKDRDMVSVGLDFATKSDFEKNVEEQHTQFKEVLAKAVDRSANDDDLMELLKHSMCFRS
jgi:hypothetical protein